MWLLIIMGGRSVQVQVNFIPAPLWSFAHVCRLNWHHCRGCLTTVIRFSSPTHRYASSLLVEISKYLCLLTINLSKFNNSKINNTKNSIQTYYLLMTLISTEQLQTISMSYTSQYAANVPRLSICGIGTALKLSQSNYRRFAVIHAIHSAFCCKVS